LTSDSFVISGWWHVPVILQLIRSIAPLKSREVAAVALPEEEQFQPAVSLCVLAPGGEQELQTGQLFIAPTPVAPSCQ
jgi:hypothetical protein